MIALRDQACYVPGLPNDLRIVFSQVICTSEGYKGTPIAHCHDEHDSYAELNFKRGKNPDWHKAKPVQMVYVNYDPNNKLPTHEATIPNHRQKELKALTSDECVTKKANKNSLLHRKSYSDVTLDWYILGSNMSNG